ncbi:MAG: hypothetical protein MRERV_21c003 [Mycoplasmataceae bacterium RV_VA103A]|nr:MAG: hypothetical protein MRERV_21c003 [Mycoplasmataceae bacterium RV_VA103A]
MPKVLEFILCLIITFLFSLIAVKITGEGEEDWTDYCFILLLWALVVVPYLYYAIFLSSPNPNFGPQGWNNKI